MTLKKINSTNENNNLLKNACFYNITDNRKLRSRKNRRYAEDMLQPQIIDYLNIFAQKPFLI